MEKRIAEKWVNALRSGKYKQGKNTLKQVRSDEEVTYCCLGVLAEECGVMDVLSGSQNLQEWKNRPIEDVNGVRKDKKDIKIGKQCYESLADANDDGTSFKEIADYIFENYKDL